LIAGTTDTGDGSGSGRAFTVWPSRPLTLLGTLGGRESHGVGMNEHGDVVGSSFSAEGYTHAFHQTGSTIVDLGPRYASDINNLRFTAGWNERQAVVWSPAGASRLLPAPLMPPADDTWWWSGATGGINDRGQAAGFYTAQETPHAVRWDPDGTIVVLGVGAPTAINEAGDVTGWGFGVPGFVWRASSGWVDLWDIMPLGMNDAGQVVGICNDYEPSSNPCVWSEATGLVRLAKPVEGYSRATAINDLGEVVGSLGEWDGPGHVLFWYAPPAVAEQLSTVRRSIGILRDDNVFNHGRYTSLNAMLRNAGRAWQAGDRAGAARFLEQMSHLLAAGNRPATVRNRTVRLDALLQRLALRLREPA
jgi:probable HAF family extracellular repeat protein